MIPSFVSRNHTSILAFFLFAAVYCVHATSRVTTSFDSGWAIYVSRSLVQEGNVSLNEYKQQIRQKKLHGVRKINGRFYNFFPVGTSVLAAPLVILFETAPIFIVSWIPGFPRAAQLYRDKGLYPTATSAHIEMERATASVFIAVTAVLLFLIGRHFLSLWMAMLLSVIFAFCTPAWSTGSRALWPHGPTMLLLALALYLLIKAKERPHLAQYAALPLAFSFVVRPSNIVSILFLSCYICFTHREYFIRYVLWGLLIAAGFAWYNLEIHGAFIPRYYQPGRVQSHPHLIEAFLANLFSPSRGIFIFSPVFLLCFFAFIRPTLLNPYSKLGLYSGAICFFHTLLISSFPNWWGGHAYGPRYMSDIVPYLIFLLIPLVRLLEAGSTRTVKLLSLTLLLLLVSSFSLNWIGATKQSTLSWNVIPKNIDNDQSRIWDWKDPQFLRFSNAPRHSLLR
jgi:hypothetical protein